METAITQPLDSTTWVLLVDTEVNTDYLIQNIGRSKALICAKDTIPLDDLAYMVLGSECSIVPHMLAGKIWGKAQTIEQAFISVSVG